MRWFTGLKILRCCDHCNIVGIIKGEKKYRGAHWHCYKCKNGFNRKDEAIKHYKTHFRNPQTTFQIQIAQVCIQCTIFSYAPWSILIVAALSVNLSQIFLRVMALNAIKIWVFFGFRTATLNLVIFVSDTGPHIDGS